MGGAGWSKTVPLRVGLSRDVESRRVVDKLADIWES